MADFNLIQRGELQQRLVRGLEIKERAPAPNLAPEVVPVVLLEDLTRQTPFNQAIGRHAFGNTNVSAVVGEFGQSDLVNPVGSGVIAIVTGVTCDTAGTYSVGRLTGNPAANPAGLGWMDNRNGPVPTIRHNFGADPINVIAQSFYRFLMTETRWHELHHVLLPGESVTIQISTANLNFVVTWNWTEYLQ